MESSAELEALSDAEFRAIVDPLTKSEFAALPFFQQLRYIGLLLLEANTPNYESDRPALERRNGERLRFTAKVSRFGTKPRWGGPREVRTVLLVDVRFCDTGELATDHIWLAVGITIDALCLAPGDAVEFDARIGMYRKGHYSNGQTISYKLSRPTKWAVVRAGAT